DGAARHTVDRAEGHSEAFDGRAEVHREALDRREEVDGEAFDGRAEVHREALDGREEVDGSEVDREEVDRPEELGKSFTAIAADPEGERAGEIRPSLLSASAFGLARPRARPPPPGAPTTRSAPARGRGARAHTLAGHARSRGA